MISLLFISLASPSEARCFLGKGKKVGKPSFMFNINTSVFPGLCEPARQDPSLLSSQGRCPTWWGSAFASRTKILGNTYTLL